MIRPSTTPTKGPGDRRRVGDAERAVSNHPHPEPAPIAGSRIGKGLGRGLAGILDTGADGRLPPTTSGLSRLFGFMAPSGGRRVRDYVVEVALDAVAEAFALDGIVLVGLGKAESPVSLAVRMPLDMGPSSPLLFEVYGRLWARLRQEQSAVADGGFVQRLAGSSRTPVGDRWLSISQWRSSNDPTWQCLVGGAFRAEPFTAAESEALGRSLRSVVSVVTDANEKAPDRLVPQVSVSRSGRSAVSADVQVDLHGDGRSVSASGSGGDLVTAVAVAAANVCRPKRRVLFAGSSEVDGTSVTVVIVEEPDGAPVLGVSLRPGGDRSGPAHAVFSTVESDLGGRIADADRPH